MRDDDGGDLRSPFAVDPDDPVEAHRLGRSRRARLHASRGRAFLLGYWDGYIARLQSARRQGLPLRRRLQGAARRLARADRRAPRRATRGCLFAAETLGCTFDETKATAGAGFDYLFNSFAWWDLRAPWALEHYEALRIVAPSIAFPENHDMARLAADARRRARARSRATSRRATRWRPSSRPAC